MATKVTLCIFCYNQKPFARAAMAAAFNQDYLNLEIVITDDTSTDGTDILVGELVQAYRGPHRVVFQKNPVNVGLVESINRAMAAATGEFMVIAAADDISYPSRCRTLVDAWEKHDRKIHLVHSGFRRIDEHDRELPLTPGEVQLQAKPAPFVQRENPEDVIRSFVPYVFGCTAGWDRTLVDRFGPLRSRCSQEDVVMALRGTLTGGVLFLPQQLVDYRLHSSNAYHINFQLADSGVVRTKEEFEQLEGFKLRNLRYKGPIHDNFEADVASAAQEGFIPSGTAKSLTDYIQRQRQLAQAEIQLRGGGVTERTQALLELRRLEGKVRGRDVIRLLPKSLYRFARTSLYTRKR